MSLVHGKLSALSIKTVIWPNIRNSQIKAKYITTLLHYRKSRNKFFTCFNVSYDWPDDSYKQKAKKGSHLII